MDSRKIGSGWSHETKLEPAQRRIVVTAAVTYASFYLGRLNLSIALPAMTVALGYTRAELGVLGTVFFWTYGLGQFFVGEIGNLVRPRLIIALGLGIAVIVNGLFALQTALWVLALLWGINGVGQAMGWSPMLRMIGDHLTPPQRARVATLFPISFQIGAALTFVVVGLLVAIGGWQAGFTIPALLLALITAWWWHSGLDAKPTAGTASAVARPAMSFAATRADVVRLWPILLSAVCCGFVLGGATLWIPTYVVDTGVIPAAAIGAVSAAMPLIGIIGMVASSQLMRRLRRADTVLLIVLGSSAIALLLAAPSPLALQAVLLLGALASLGGVGAVLTSALPLQTAGPGRMSSTAGFVNGMMNLGGGLAGVGTGTLLQSAGWGAVLAAWGISCVLAVGWAWWFWRANQQTMRTPA